MKRVIVVLIAAAAGLGPGFAAAQAPDAVFLHGKIVTVDDFFSIREAVAVRDGRFVAVGSDEDVAALVGPATRTYDLHGATVIPGLIDNHIHVIRATEYWPNEVRLDGVASRAEALALLEAKAHTLPPDAWLMSLGGWSEHQFLDSRDSFTLEELDALAPERPVFLQVLYDHAYGNSAWFEAVGIPLETSPSERLTTGLASFVERDARGRATGRLDGGFPMIALAIGRFPPVPPQRQTEAIRTALSFLNGIGLTSVYDPGGLGLRQESYERIAELAAEGGLTVRIFRTLSGGVPRTPVEAEGMIDALERTTPFQGDSAHDTIALGEIYYGPFHWDDDLRPTSPTVQDVAVGRRVLETAARLAWPVQTHATQPQTIDTLLDVIAEINTRHPVRQLRWSIAHADNIAPHQIERARALGMNLQLRSISVVGGREAVQEAFGEQAYRMPPLRRVQDSGIPFGLGTDGTKAGQINPFVTLWWAVTGKSLHGDVILHETLSREEALIAHTRANAYLMFQEAQLGSIEPGLLADMVVLDRDYLAVPADQIREIRPVATIVGGRIVYGAL